MFDVFVRIANEPTFPNIMLLINSLIFIIFFMMYFHHHIFLVLACVTRDKKYPEAKTMHKYAYVVCARNEAQVIGNLIDSINQQNYPKELMQVFVVADNCTDNTAEVARMHGAICYERFNETLKGKSYALDEGLKWILKDYQESGFEAFIVFDADNLVTTNFTLEVNKAYDSGHKVCTTFRNSKNFGSSWISAGASYMFYREARIVQRARKFLNSGTYISGTGFLVDKDIIIKQNGWPYHTMIEDIEFSVDQSLKDQKIAYVYDAEVYDEQPSTLKGFWNQGMRWYKGIHQCFRRYASKLFKRSVTKLDFTAYDLATHITPFPMFLLWLPFIFLTANGIYTIAINESFTFYWYNGLLPFLQEVGITYIYGVATALILSGMLWKKIHAKWWQKILYAFTFPFYIYIYLVIATISLFKKVVWVPTKHTEVKTLEELEKPKKR